MVAHAAFWPLPHEYRGEGIGEAINTRDFSCRQSYRQSYRYFSGLIVNSPLSLGFYECVQQLINTAQCGGVLCPSSLYYQCVHSFSLIESVLEVSFVHLLVHG
jgi:hypothetical protein